MNDESLKLNRAQFKILADSVQQYLVDSFGLSHLQAGLFAAELVSKMEKPIIRIIEANISTQPQVSEEVK